MLPMVNRNTVGFAQPLALLRACHDKILQQCTTLERLVPHLAAHGNDAQAQQAAQGVLRYFGTAGQLHHLDEEENLFPRLRQANADSAALLVRLEAEHAEMLTAWARLQVELQALALAQCAALSAQNVSDFVRRYRDHVALENAVLLPQAERWLSAQEIEKIGRAMAARRGVAMD